MWKLIFLDIYKWIIVYSKYNKTFNFFKKDNIMKSYEEIIEQVLHHEGGYVNDPTDLGGETNFGITKRFYPDVDIKNLTK